MPGLTLKKDNVKPQKAYNNTTSFSLMKTIEALRQGSTE